MRGRGRDGRPTGGEHGRRMAVEVAARAGARGAPHGERGAAGAPLAPAGGARRTGAAPARRAARGPAGRGRVPAAGARTAGGARRGRRRLRRAGATGRRRPLRGGPGPGGAGGEGARTAGRGPEPGGGGRVPGPDPAGVRPHHGVPDHPAGLRGPHRCGTRTPHRRVAAHGGPAGGPCRRGGPRLRGAVRAVRGGDPRAAPAVRPDHRPGPGGMAAGPRVHQPRGQRGAAAAAGRAGHAPDHRQGGAGPRGGGPGAAARPGGLGQEHPRAVARRQRGPADGRSVEHVRPVRAAPALVHHRREPAAAGGLPQGLGSSAVRPLRLGRGPDAQRPGPGPGGRRGRGPAAAAHPYGDLAALPRLRLPQGPVRGDHPALGGPGGLARRAGVHPALPTADGTGGHRGVHRALAPGRAGGVSWRGPRRVRGVAPGGGLRPPGPRPAGHQPPDVRTAVRPEPGPADAPAPGPQGVVRRGAGHAAGPTGHGAGDRRGGGGLPHAGRADPAAPAVRVLADQERAGGGGPGRGRGAGGRVARRDAAGAGAGGCGAGVRAPADPQRAAARTGEGLGGLRPPHLPGLPGRQGGRGVPRLRRPGQERPRRHLGRRRPHGGGPRPPRRADAHSAGAAPPRRQGQGRAQPPGPPGRGLP